MPLRVTEAAQAPTVGWERGEMGAVSRHWIKPGRAELWEFTRRHISTKNINRSSSFVKQLLHAVDSAICIPGILQITLKDRLLVFLIERWDKWGSRKSTCQGHPANRQLGWDWNPACLRIHRAPHLHLPGILQHGSGDAELGAYGGGFQPSLATSLLHGFREFHGTCSPCLVLLAELPAMPFATQIVDEGPKHSG